MNLVDFLNNQFKFLILYLSIITLFNFKLLEAEQNVNSECNLKDLNNSTGICKNFRDCDAVLSNLRAGINPILCNVRGKKGIVCCPDQKSISEQMCDKYKEVLKRPLGATPLLPSYFLAERPKGVQCESHIQVNKLIVGGRDALPDEFPHMAAVGWGNDIKSLEFRCGGTLISEKFVLTAAHCVETKIGKPTHVLIGSNSIRLLGSTSKKLIIKIKEHLIYPKYKKPLTYHDIALLRLSTPVKISRSVLPACLPSPNLRLENVVKVSSAGWGQTSSGGRSSETLQAVNLTRYDHTECFDEFKNLPDRSVKYPSGILRSQICAGDPAKGKDTCSGDSGGPLIAIKNGVKCVYYVVGITSFGPSFCGVQSGVYTNVQSYLEWIQNNIWPPPSSP